METIKINLGSPTHGLSPLNIRSITERNGELEIVLRNWDCYTINPGDNLTIERQVARDDGTYLILSETVNITREDENHVLYGNPIVSSHIPIDRSSTTLKEISIDGTDYCIIDLHETHHLFQQDLSLNAGQELYFKDADGNVLGTFSDFSIPLKRNDRTADIDDCLSFVGKEKTCGKKFPYVYTYQYSFLPEKISETALIIKSFKQDILNQAVYIEPKYNSFYYYYINVDEEGNPSEFDDYGEPVRHCILYGDPWWYELSHSEKNDLKYENIGLTKTSVFKNDAFWNIGLGIGNSANETDLGKEDTFGLNLIQETEEKLIPTVVDMERVKYSPVIFQDGKYSDATGITFSFHFRQRKRQENKTKVYEDGWYIDNDNSSAIWWNGCPETEATEFAEDSALMQWMETNVYQSDGLGYLNFTDDDVFFQKKKISQTFARLSFYTSKDPIEQKLLYYSTIFLDSGVLYGKYIKNLLTYDNESVLSDYQGIDSVKILFANMANSGLDTKLAVTNEYDRVSSSEGFNLYLFADDAPAYLQEYEEVQELPSDESAEIDKIYRVIGAKDGIIISSDRSYESIAQTAEELDFLIPHLIDGKWEWEVKKGSKTIYMKVEFNHAGNGKTIPFVQWPKDNNGNYVGLTVSNYFDSVYIPVRIAYLNNRYVYMIPDCENTDDIIQFGLFEPKLDVESADNYE